MIMLAGQLPCPRMEICLLGLFFCDGNGSNSGHVRLLRQRYVQTM
jgi:hypothetical protein